MPSTDLDQAIHEVIVASHEMFADHAIDEAIERLHREHAEELRKVNTDYECK